MRLLKGYIKYIIPAPFLIRDGLPTSDLDKELTVPRHKALECYRGYIRPRPWTDSLE